MTISRNSPAPVYGTEVQLPEVTQSLVTYPENSSPSQQPLKIDPTGKYVEGDVIVRYNPKVVGNNLSYQAASTAANQKINPRKIEEIGSKSMPGIQYVNLPQNISVNEAVDIYLHDSNVSWAQPNYIYYPARVSNDPMFNEQWAFQNTGQSVNGQTGGTPDADIDLPEAWDTFTGPVGSNDVIIAVVDSGVDFTHPDLTDNIWTNPGEMGVDSQGRDKRSNGVDDDGSGIVDDWHGWNLVDITGNITDDTGHGTVCAGAIGATGNNAIGVSGVIWKMKILPVKVTNSQGFATDFWIMQGMSRAYDRGARIFSISWVSDNQGDWYIRDFIRDNNDGLFICAAGNIDEYYPQPNNEIIPLYPASYDYNNIISVAATDNHDNLSSFSHYGVNSVDLAAPGENIVLPHAGGGYEYTGGTSISTPIVAGVAGLIKSINPSASPTSIKNLILQNVDHKSSLSGLVSSGGRLNAHLALSASPIRGSANCEL